MFKTSQLSITIYLISIMPFFSCTWGQQLSELSTKYQSMQEQINNIHSNQEKLIIEQRCKNPKVLRLITECEQLGGGGNICESKKQNTEDLIRFMSTERHVLVRLFPSAGFERIAEQRVVQLARLLDPEDMLSVSKVLIIVQPDSDEQSRLDGALSAAREMRKYIINKLQIKERVVYGPLTIPCNADKNMLDIYSREVHDDRPVNGEPPSKTPSVAIWIFRLDCPQR
ncbi:MAG: hypothetical protein JNM40_02740 [Myxococcales bacterium]|nr:hypothetical protein [Myxococcales bacterium]